MRKGASLLFPLLIALGLLTYPSAYSLVSAQTGPTGLPAPIQPQISPVQTPSPPPSGLPANVQTPSTTTQLTAVPGPQTRAIFNSAGNGLPGMPGGPPVNTISGARDPSPSYMTPPIVGPLLCDPAIDIC